jgi:hypothetical protein
MRDETPKAISYQLRTPLDNIIRPAAPSDFTEDISNVDQKRV